LERNAEAEPSQEQDLHKSNDSKKDHGKHDVGFKLLGGRIGGRESSEFSQGGQEPGAKEKKGKKRKEGRRFGGPGIRRDKE